MKSRMLRTLALATVCICFLVMGGFQTAYAGSTNQASGKCGNCSWSIDGDGVFSIYPTEADEEGILADWDIYPPWHGHGSKVKSVNIPERIRVKTCSYMFDGFKMTSLDLTNLDTSEVKNMQCMLQGCSLLDSVDLSMLDTSEVTNFGGIFWNCFALKDINVSTWDTHNAVDMSGIFQGCNELCSIDLSNFNTENATNFANFFDGCKKLTRIDIRGFDTTNAESMSRFFGNCSVQEIALGSKTILTGLLSNSTSENQPPYQWSRNTLLDGSPAACPGLRTLYYYDGSNPGWYSKNGDGVEVAHSWNDNYTTDIPATCTEEGKESIYCALCGEKKEDSERVVAKKEHVYGPWMVKKKATCTDVGLEERVCGVCNDLQTRAIPIRGHNWGTPTYKWAADNSKIVATRTCKNDYMHKETETVNANSKVTKAATYTTKGQTVYTGVFKNPAFKTQVKRLLNIPMLPKNVNPMTVKTAKKTVKVNSIKKKSKTVKAITVTKARGKVTYKVVSGNAKSTKALKVNLNTGKITVKKKTKKGIYKVRVKVTAAGNVSFKPGSKTVTVVIRVK